MKTFQEFSEKQPNFGEVFEEGVFGSLFGRKQPQHKYLNDPKYGVPYRRIFDQLVAQGVSMKDAPAQAEKIIDQKLATPAGAWELQRMAAQMNVTDDASKDKGVSKLSVTHPNTSVTQSSFPGLQQKARRLTPGLE